MSLGASITNRVSATSPASPLTYQWKLNGVEIPGATTNFLVLVQIGLTNAEAYTVLVGDAEKTAVESAAAVLEVDGTFTKVTDDPVAKVLRCYRRRLGGFRRRRIRGSVPHRI